MKFRKILKEIIGDRLNELLAESKIDNLKKLGLNDDNSNIVFGIFKGISVIFAKKLIDKFMQEYNVDRQEAVRNINNTNYFSRMLEKMISIKDYIDVEFRGTNIESLKELSFDQIYQKSVEWHENIEKGEAQINYKENENNVIIDFRKNGEGFYWVDLKTKNSRDECKRMGHCGRSEYGNLYSFREYKNLSKKGYTSNESHLTAAIDIEDGILYQLKGAKNSKPLPRFHPYILALLNYKNYGDYLIKEIKSEYDGRNDFKPSDLNNSEFNKLLKDRKDLVGIPDVILKYGIDRAVDLYNYENVLNSLTWDAVGYLLENADDPDEMSKKIIDFKGFELMGHDVEMILSATKNRDKLAMYIIDVMGNKLNDSVIYSLIKLTKNREELSKKIFDLVGNKMRMDSIRLLAPYFEDIDKFINDVIDINLNMFDSNVINFFLERSKNPDLWIEKIIKFKLYKLNSEDIVKLVYRYKNPDKLAMKVIEDKGENLDKYTINNFVEKSENPDKIISKIINKKEKSLDFYDFSFFLKKYSKPDKIIFKTIELIGKSLYAYQLMTMLNYSNHPDDIILMYLKNINKPINRGDIFHFLNESKNPNNIKRALIQAGIDKKIINEGIQVYIDKNERFFPKIKEPVELIP